MNGVTFMPVGPSALSVIPQSVLSSVSPSSAGHTSQSTGSANSNGRELSAGNTASTLKAPPAPSAPQVAAKPAATPAPAASQASTASAGLTAADVAELALSEGFSTTIGGKHYIGSVIQSNGEYTASVASVWGATATGSTEPAAENNLVGRIDVLV